MSLGLPEILIVLVIILILFGRGRISSIAGELGSSIRSFRDGLKNDKKETTEEDNKKDKPAS